MRHSLRAALCCLSLVLGLSTPALAQDSSAAVLSASAREQRFTLLLFWKQDDAATQALNRDAQAAVAGFADRAALATVNVGDPGEQESVKRFNVARAPMPMLLVVAPNGAVTGHYRTGITEATLSKALVTPTMCICMKALQEGKVVLVCVQPPTSPIPLGVRAFVDDPSFRDRAVAVKLSAANAAEARFVEDLKLTAFEQNGSVAMLAPPGMMVGKFATTVSADELAAKLHAAGKCCDDENCKHHKKGVK